MLFVILAAIQSCSLSEHNLRNASVTLNYKAAPIHTLFRTELGFSFNF